ncbi:hypothetical protein JCM10213v2_005457 [Rhodosporidiobolus nylandii]
MPDGETNWAEFKYLAPSQNVHAPSRCPPSDPFPSFPPSHDPGPARLRTTPPAFSSPFPSPSPSLSQSLSNSSSSLSDSPLSPFTPPAEDCTTTQAAPDFGDSEANPEAEEREEGEEVGGRGALKSIGLGVDVPTPVREYAPTVRGAHRRAQPPAPRPPHPSHALPPTSDHSIPLRTRLAGKVETLVGKGVRDDALVVEGRVKRFGPEVVLPKQGREAVGGGGAGAGGAGRGMRDGGTDGV